MNSGLDKYLSVMQPEENELIEHKRKKTTYLQREEVNNISYTREPATLTRKCIEYGCDELKGVKITKDNFFDLLNDLSSIELNELGTFIYMDINKLLQDKKKLSKPDSQLPDSSEEHSSTEEN